MSLTVDGARDKLKAAKAELRKAQAAAKAVKSTGGKASSQKKSRGFPDDADSFGWSPEVWEKASAAQRRAGRRYLRSQDVTVDAHMRTEEERLAALGFSVAPVAPLVSYKPSAGPTPTLWVPPYAVSTYVTKIGGERAYGSNMCLEAAPSDARTVYGFWMMTASGRIPSGFLAKGTQVQVYVVHGNGAALAGAALVPAGDQAVRGSMSFIPNRGAPGVEGVMIDLEARRMDADIAHLIDRATRTGEPADAVIAAGRTVALQIRALITTEKAAMRKAPTVTGSVYGGGAENQMAAEFIMAHAQARKAKNAWVRDARKFF